jgi:hypothetical protein
MGRPLNVLEDLAILTGICRTGICRIEEKSHQAPSGTAGDIAGSGECSGYGAWYQRTFGAAEELFFYRRRIIFKKFLHRLGEVLLLLFWLGFLIDGFAHQPTPNDLL